MKKKVPEELVVADANTVADPWTVMVHAHHTSVAYGAVMGARWPYVVALVAVAPPDESEHT